VAPPREKDDRNGFRARSLPSLSMLASMMIHPIWCLGAIADGVPRIGNIDRYKKMGWWVMDQSAGLGKQIDPTLTWEDMNWFRSIWDGRMIIKGITSAEDALLALNCEADGLIVSNHGGRRSRVRPASADSDWGELVVPSWDGERHRSRRVRPCDGRHHEDRRRHRLAFSDGAGGSGGAAVIKPHLCRAERACDGRRADGFLV
jgi:hypothetical protein